MTPENQEILNEWRKQYLDERIRRNRAERKTKTLIVIALVACPLAAWVMTALKS